MKFPFLASIILSVICFSCTSTPDSDKATTTEAVAVTNSTTGDTWKVDTSASKVEWIGAKVTARHSGSINISSGELNVKDTGITGGKFTMNMTSIQVTGPEGSDAGANKKLHGHLISPDFFDVAAHPTATFEITGIQPFTGTVKQEDETNQAEISKYKVADPTHTISGNLTIKGISKNIEFPAKITVDGNSANALAKFNIDRTQWKIIYPGKPDDLIRNDIHFGILLHARK